MAIIPGRAACKEQNSKFRLTRGSLAKAVESRSGRVEAFVVGPRGAGIWAGLNEFGAFTVGYPVGILCTYYRKSQSTANIVGLVNRTESRFP
ncbi:hypothetical protein KPH14_007492 [Odynerus spinipes]|uniref:Uncharacterized protein n=1 Tax=Odynerus spinipes TaxID=1348599 RepID=A0AAD9VIN7_9HYME|nr:hypothetical protein KPH14_007492 [Odynerus spinipes]